MGSTQLFHGDEHFLIEEQVEAKTRSLSDYTLEVAPSTITAQDLYTVVASQDLFASSKLILLKDPQLILKAQSDKELKNLVSALESINSGPHELVIYFVTKSLDKRKKGYTKIKNLVQLKEFKSFKDWEQDKVLDWLKNRIAKKGKKISHEALLALEQSGGVNLRHIAGELEKILVYIGNKDEITIKDITEISSNAGASAFHFNEAMKRRNKKEMLKIGTSLLDNNEDPIRLLGLLTANLRLYTQMVDMNQQRSTPQTIAKNLGKNPYFIKNLLRDVSKAYRLEDLKILYTKTAQKDVEIKTGRINSRQALEWLFTQF